MIPIIRLTDLESGQPDAIDQLHGSLREYTFAHVDARHELGAGFFTSLHQQTQEFFALPADEKAALDIGKSQNYRGYVGPGMEYTSGVPDLKESFEFGQELPEPAGERQSWFGLYGSNQWPPRQRLPSFRPVIDAYLNAMTRVAGTVLNSLMLTLGLPVTQERGLASGTLCCFARLIHYHHPSGYSSEGTRLARHTDSGMITIGLQNAPGLEVEVPSGDWLPVCPPPDVFTVFPGELAEAWARGYYRACAHRVHNAALSGDRLSYACFVLPDLTRGLAPVDIASCARLPEADLPALGANSWLAGRAALAGDIPIGQLEWERMNVIFPDQAEAAPAGGEGG